MTYAKPRVDDLGSITEHTFFVGGTIKGGEFEPVAHIDKFCEWSGGSGTDFCDEATSRQ